MRPQITITEFYNCQRADQLVHDQMAFVPFVHAVHIRRHCRIDDCLYVLLHNIVGTHVKITLYEQDIDASFTRL